MNEKDYMTKKDYYVGLANTFGIFMLGMLLLFPGNVIEMSFPLFMMVFRELAVMVGLGAVAVLFILPISFLDIQYIAIINRELNLDNFTYIYRVFGQNNIFFALSYIAFIFMFIIAIDTVFSAIGYRFAFRLRQLLENKIKPKDMKSTESFIAKFGPFGMFLAAAVPVIPYTIAIYVSGAIKMDFKKFIIATAAGRFIKWLLVTGLALGLWNFIF